ncbi:beta-N-acetylhexosaminidase [Adhaeribacter rhizoryzae]|nr:family 20 glycosylhydrolase [Adhaeribacter rhizoryzae]
MMRVRTLLLLWLSIICINLAGAQTTTAPESNISIIPQPVSLKLLPGNFQLTAKTKIYITPQDQELKLLAGMLADQLKSTTGHELTVIEKANALKAKNAIILSKQPTDTTLGKEGYALTVRPENIVVRATHGHGIFYGLQTIYQLLPAGPEAVAGKAAVAIPAVDIQDKPRYSWRGLMLDVGRYFYPVEFIKKYLDYMAMHKLNTFHWHLTEDHGWRIEIKKYPRLTQIGANREGTQVGNRDQIDYRPHSGYYTQEQIKDVVAYASARYINVVPEVEMPGHTLAVLAAYPELSCTGGPHKMPLQWGIQKDIYCAGNDQTFTFLEDVLTEVAALFPSPIIHIGGDEAPKDRWKACAKCQARIKAENLKDEHELQSYFIKRIEKFLLTKNKNIIGWDEILEGGLAPNASVMSWRGIKGGIAAAKEHHNVVMTPSSHLYLDYYQGDRALEPKAIGGMLLLEKVYSYEPTPAELTPAEAKYIIGTQGNVWAEYIHTPEKAEYYAFPRAAALAEVAWTPANLKNWDNFKKRMETQYKRYDAIGLNYAKSAYNVFMEVTPDTEAKNITVSLKTGSHGTRIFYTLDGTEPTLESLQYTMPFKIINPTVVKATAFQANQQVGKVTTRTISEQDLTGKKE